MKMLNGNGKNVILELSKYELGVLGNALNEVCNGIEVWEFGTRMGIAVEEARNMLDTIITIYESVNESDSES